MKKCFLITLVMLAGMLQVAGAKNEDPNLGIIPAPVSIARKAGTFHLTTATRLAATGTEAQQVAGMFNAFLKENYGYTLKTTQESAPGNNSIVLAIRENVAPKEGYRLAITRKSIAIQGADGPGLFHGLQSLIQMLPVEKQADYTLPCAIINDYPRFTYRGMHLDCGRHFFPVSFVKEYLDMMARYKFNTFHWHLTEDQGWRIEIKKYPRLTTIGSRRNETVIGHNSGKYDGKPYGGYYTQDQIRDVVQYARERYIT
ncbi:MAG TPA: family 20 glycosylhydrolase, partial [Chitinophagaceae bacterium]|nr:family 20 glycosylhydrolase [Chitinophagaceae bacterium]